MKDVLLVLLGGAVTLLAGALVAIAGERREARFAARLILHELVKNYRDGVYPWLSDGGSRHSPAPILTTREWEAHRSALARASNGAAFEATSGFYEAASPPADETAIQRRLHEAKARCWLVGYYGWPRRLRDLGEVPFPGDALLTESPFAGLSWRLRFGSIVPLVVWSRWEEKWRADTARDLTYSRLRGPGDILGLPPGGFKWGHDQFPELELPLRPRRRWP